MDKLVYLFELDSARTTPWEIEEGQKALLRQLALGNYVVLTYNQLADSPAFLACVYDEGLYNRVVKLFENGGLRISYWAYADEIVRSPSQYVQNAIKRTRNSKNDAFIFASLPSVKNRDAFLKLVEEALRTGNPDLIKDYRTGGLTLEIGGVEVNPLEGVREKDVGYLVRYIDLIVRLSIKSKYGIAALEGHQGPGMDVLIKDAIGKISFLVSHRELAGMRIAGKPSFNSIRALWSDASVLLANLHDKLSANNTVHQRSAWHKELIVNCGDPDDARKLADAVVDLCYSFAMMYSINPEYNALYDEETFAAELLEKLIPYWQSIEAGNHECSRTGTGDHRNMAERDPSKDRMKDWGNVVDLRLKGGEPLERPELEEGASEKGIRRWARKYKLRAARAFAAIAIGVAVFFLITAAFEIASQPAEGFLYGIFPPINSCVGLIVVNFVEAVVLAIVAMPIVSRIPKSDMGNSLRALARAGSELCMITRIENNELWELSHRDRSDIAAWRNLLKSYSPQTGGAFMETAEFKSRIDEYLRFSRERQELFLAGVPYPVVLDRATIAEYESGHRNVRIGLRYQSDYNILVVDLLDAGKGNYIVYERVVPAVSHGAVVTVPVQDGKFVLLYQYRHAIQGYQLAFPRGFGEAGVSPEDNAAKEILEETGARTLQTRLIGEITMNSGLESGRVSVVYCRVQGARVMSGHEGIRGLVLVSAEKLQQMIADGEITDAPTLAAYAYYCIAAAERSSRFFPRRRLLW